MRRPDAMNGVPSNGITRPLLSLALDPCLIYDVSSDEGMAAGSGTSLLLSSADSHRMVSVCVGTEGEHLFMLSMFDIYLRLCVFENHYFPISRLPSQAFKTYRNFNLVA